MRDAPTDITVKRSEGVVQITWRDGAPHRHAIRAIRCACPCAGCVDEWTGERTLDVASVPADVAITHMELQGRYAVRFTFSDGHDTGIFSWDRLHAMPTAG